MAPWSIESKNQMASPVNEYRRIGGGPRSMSGYARDAILAATRSAWDRIVNVGFAANARDGPVVKPRPLAGIQISGRTRTGCR